MIDETDPFKAAFTASRGRIDTSVDLGIEAPQERKGLMRLRSPTHLDWDSDPLPDDFAMIADKDDNHEMYEVRDVSNHAAVQLIADGWVKIDD